MNEHSPLQKHFLCGILAPSNCGAIKALDQILVLIGGILTIIGGVFMVIFGWIPLLTGAIVGLIALVWGIIATATYFL